MLVAYNNHNYYGFNKHTPLLLEESLRSHCRPDRSIVSRVLRPIQFFERRRDSLRSPDDKDSLHFDIKSCYPWKHSFFGTY